MVREHAFNLENLSSYEKLNIMLETRGWTYPNKLIKDINQSIGFEFYANATNKEPQYYSSYVLGKHID